MTNERAKEILTMLICQDTRVEADDYEQALDMAIKALSQEPCTDAVSRKAVINLFKGNIGSEAALILHKVKQLPSVSPQPCDDAISRDAVLNAIEHEDKWLLFAKGHNGLTEMAFSGLKARVDALPSVTQKSGKWIETDDKYGAFFICDKCHRQSDIMENFCPNCGARMESEVRHENKYSYRY